jgi:MFS family permease
MVFTHLPSNLFLILVPLMPSLPLAILVLLLRFSISQMDVPTRQAYTMAVVAPEERSAAAGVTGVARSLGAAISPLLATMLVESPALMSVPFFLSGGIKIVYDLLLYWNFVGAGESQTSAPADRAPADPRPTPRAGWPCRSFRPDALCSGLRSRAIGVTMSPEDKTDQAREDRGHG